jgi:hypothetical protein
MAVPSRVDRSETALVAAVLSGIVILWLPVYFPSLVGPMQILLAVLVGVVCAAVSAPSITEQVAYSLPFLMITLGVVLGDAWWVDRGYSRKLWVLLLVSVAAALPGIVVFFSLRALLLKRR